MNKKNIFFSVLQFAIFILSAEQRTYYINPETSTPISITRNADVKTYSYTYYILNEYGNYVFGSKNNHCLASETVSREKFFSTIEDYQRPSQIEVNWNYKRDNAKNKDPFLKDGEYKLHLIETERRDINKKDNEGVNAVMLAIYSRNLSLLKFLIANGAYPEGTDLFGNTLLHIAIQNEDVNTTKFLINQDCDIHAPNDKGTTPLDLLKSSKNEDLQSITKIYE